MSEKTKKLWEITAILAVNLALLILISSVSARAERLGSSGERVAEIQRELQKRGLLGECENGVFDFSTRRAVADFQLSNGIEGGGEVTYETLSMLGLGSEQSYCFSAEAEILARCVGMSGCMTYPEMLRKAEEILAETEGALTLGKYISMKCPEVVFARDEPSAEEYSAAICAIRKSARNGRI